MEVPALVPGVWVPEDVVPEGLPLVELPLLEDAAPGPTPITTLDAKSSVFFFVIEALGPSSRT